MPTLSAKRVALALLGSAILAFGLCHIHAHAEVTEGGVLGLVLLLEHHFSLSPALTSLVATVLCYLFGWRMLGREFLWYSALSAGGFSLFYALFDLMPPILAGVAAHPLLAATVGALFVGVGCGRSVRAGGAPSGDDALAMALSARFSLDIRLIYLFTDLTVLGLSLTYIPLRRILFSLLTVLLSGQIVGLLQRKRKKETDAPKNSPSPIDGTPDL